MVAEVAVETITVIDFQTMNIIAVILGPLLAVLISLWIQHRKEKRNQMQTVFLTLMAHRKTFPPTGALVESLNLIDVVFSKHPNVVRLWHEYFSLLGQQPINLDETSRKFLDLLSEIARILGYSSLKQTDIDMFYTPIAHGDQARLENDIQTEWLRVLRGTQSLNVEQKERDA